MNNYQQESLDIQQTQNEVIEFILQELKRSGLLKTTTELNAAREERAARVPTGEPSFTAEEQSGLIRSEALNRAFGDIEFDLQVIFSHLLKIDSALSKHQTLNQSVIQSIKLAVKKLKDELNLVEDRMLRGAGPDTIVETFRDPSAFETDQTLYGVTEAYRAALDLDREGIKLPMVHVDNALISPTGLKLGRIQITNQLGGAMREVNPENDIDKAIDGSPDTFWAETILVDEPIRVEWTDKVDTTDDFLLFNTDRWAVSGSAAPMVGYVRLTDAAAGAVGTLRCKKPVNPYNFTCELDAWAGGPGGAIFLLWGAEKVQCGALLNGYELAIDTEGRLRLSRYDSGVRVELRSTSLPFSMADGLWRRIGVRMADAHLSAVIDGVTYLNTEIPDYAPRHTGFGLAAQTGEGAGEHRITNVAIQSERLLVSHGAACELEIDFDRPTAINEIVFTPFGSYPVEIVAVDAYTTDDTSDTPIDLISQLKGNTVMTLEPKVYTFPETPAKKLRVLLNQVHYTKEDLLVSLKERRKASQILAAKPSDPDEIDAGDMVFAPVAVTRYEQEPSLLQLHEALAKQAEPSVEDLIELQEADEIIPVSRYRYSYGMTDITIRRVEYAEQGVFVSRAIPVSDSVRAVRLSVTEEKPAGTDIRYFISTGGPWLPIVPGETLNLADAYRQGGRVVPNKEIYRQKGSDSRGRVSLPAPIFVDMEALHQGLEADRVTVTVTDTGGSSITARQVERFDGTDLQFRILSATQIQLNRPLAADETITVEIPYLIKELRLKAELSRSSENSGVTPVLHDYTLHLMH